MPCNNFFIDQTNSVKMAGYRSPSLFTFLWTSSSSRSIKTQKENSANTQPSWPRASSIIYTYSTRGWRWVMMVIPCQYWCNVDFVYVWIFMTKMSTTKRSFFHVILFNFAVPHPSAWFPLNNTHKTEEIERRTTPGIKGDKVYLSLGPDGTQDGSYFFRGPHANSINFFDNKLDIGFPITIVCWLYTYDNNAKTDGFLQYKGIHLSANHKELKLSSSSSDQLLTGTLAEKGWKFVGVSYNETTAEVKLWIDGNVVNSTTLIANFYSNEPQLLKLGGNNFKGKITQLMLFNLTLTQEQMQGTKGRMKLPGETKGYFYKIKTIIFRYFESYLILN